MIAGSCGIFDGRNGPSHFAGDDLAAICTMPGMTVYEPADTIDLETSLEWALASAGPVYIRLRRNGMPQSIGDPLLTREAVRLVRLSVAPPVVTVVAVGAMLDEVLTACWILLDDGIVPELVHVLRIKPFDESAILASARRTGRILAVENHVTHGGCAAGIAMLAAREAIRFSALTLPDAILPAGDPRWLLAHCGLNATSIADHLSSLLS
ncbi:hypothetical protein HB778_37360 (plasmid) [Mesorhizobium huakuii]|uniref:Transketolase C-terminal domain-containing protein n=2 Tax=Mesorhizobium huakuii TaxID=28104 RepID=A0A7G6T522_9HYPH|nr:transketolase C-terminal domain-containing protein [Mesorhizobium huakuii]QND61854.1 hypothetical protein HB778_37360 [Mesorhizobium huakuii]QND69053.1 hypothetical protein HB777_35080 [Mesorhizobium loti]